MCSNVTMHQLFQLEDVIRHVISLSIYTKPGVLNLNSPLGSQSACEINLWVLTDKWQSHLHDASTLRTPLNTGQYSPMCVTSQPATIKDLWRTEQLVPCNRSLLSGRMAKGRVSWLQMYWGCCIFVAGFLLLQCSSFDITDVLL